MTAYATRAIREQILGGERELGSRLNQRTLAQDLGVSVIPVREALGALASEGLVVIYPHRGAYVTTLSEAEFQEIFLLRAVLDPIAAAAATERMTPEVLEALTVILDQTRDATEAGRFDEVHRLNRAFHMGLYEQAQMPILLQTIASLRDRHTVYARVVVEVPDYARRSLRDHEAILAACRRGDHDRVARLMKEHIEHAATELPKWLKKSDLALR